MKTLIIIPTLNAYKTILETLIDIKTVSPESDILVVDYGSTDRTKYLLQNNNVMYLEYFISATYNEAVSTGLEYAFNNGYDNVIQWDQDNQFNAEDIAYANRTFTNKNLDFVLGSRYVDNKVPWTQRATRHMSRNIRIFTGQKISDPRLRFRLYGRTIMKLFKDSKYFDPGIETIAHLAKAKYKFEEIQIDTSKIKKITNNKGIINVTRATILMIFTKPFKRKGAK